MSRGGTAPPVEAAPAMDFPAPPPRRRPPALSSLQAPPPLESLAPPAPSRPPMTPNPLASNGRTFDVEGVEPEQPLAAPPDGKASAGAASPAPAPAPAKKAAKGGMASMMEAIRKAQAASSENPANFHQAAAVYLLGGGRPKEQKSFPRPENVSRMTNEEMKTAWEAAEGTITSNEKLVCHFTSIESAGWILGTQSTGFRASTVGQGGGGVSVVNAGPHMLEWDSYGKNRGSELTFREKTGKELWGKKWQDVLEGAKDADKLDMVFFIKVQKAFIDSAVDVPGRPFIKIISPSVLTENQKDDEDDNKYLDKKNIVKSYILKEGWEQDGKQRRNPPHVCL